jgi:fucose 4-O-acetylase-like acetyltransferase
MKTSTKIIYWLPRILCILAILFVSMFALDSFDPKLTIWQQIAGFLIHLIPSFILALFLFVAWKWELVGGIIFALIGIGFTPFIYIHNYQMNHSVGMSLLIILCITFPFFIVGGLFITGHWLKNKQVKVNSQSVKGQE